jgi:hypothetical protein
MSIPYGAQNAEHYGEQRDITTMMKADGSMNMKMNFALMVVEISSVYALWEI